MSKLKSFTLIELLIVVVLIGVISFLTIKLPTFKENKIIKIEELRDYFYPNGTLIITPDKIISSKKIDIKITNPKVFIYNGEFKEKIFSDYNNSKVIFKYTQKNGINESFILKCNEGIYVFKPFYIKKVSSFNEAKKEFLLTAYQPKEGAYY